MPTRAAAHVPADTLDSDDVETNHDLNAEDESDESDDFDDLGQPKDGVDSDDDDTDEEDGIEVAHTSALATPTPGLDAGDYHVLPIESLIESPKNPRKRFDLAKLNELASSLKEHGVLTPLLARPSRLVLAYGEKTPTRQLYELAAGHRRYRAAKLAGLTELPVVVRQMTDTQFLEVLTIENLQRDDVHPLEEARGYQDLMREASYTAERIGDRVGKSEKYVYDRIKLLQLTPELQEVFIENKFTAGHAILLARLSPADQKRASAGLHGGLWAPEHGAQTDIEGLITPPTTGKHSGLKPQSVRELQQWINQYVRFDPTAADVADLFPSTHAMVAPAIERAERIIPITENYHVDPTAKTDERTFGPNSWKRADGKHKSKPCEHSVLGVVVVGPGRGESFRVCTDKQKCKTHWGAEIRSREAKASPSATKAKAAAAAPAKQSWQIEQERREAKRAAKRAEWEKVAPAVTKAAAEQAKKLSVNALIALLLEEINIPKEAAKVIGRGRTADDFLRHVAFGILHDAANSHRAYETFPKYARQIGLKLDPLLKAAAPPSAVTSVKPVFDKNAPKPTKAQKKRGSVADFLKPKTPSVQLAGIVGPAPLPRTEVTKKVWAYIKRNGLQNTKERRMIDADEKLRLVFGGKKQVSMFEMTKLINKHLR